MSHAESHLQQPHDHPADDSPSSAGNRNTPDAGNRQLAEACLAEAARLARRGKYAAAESLLARMPSGNGWQERALDLLARIRAQQGRLAEARAIWSRLSEDAKDPHPFLDGIERIDRRLARNAGRWFPWWPFGSKRPVGDLTGGCPHVIQRASRKGVELRFRTPLFDEGRSELREDVLMLLSQIGRRLEPYVGHAAITLIGHTNNTLRPSGGDGPDNGQLAMQRAVAVFAHLMRTTRLPATMFSLWAAAEYAPPFSNDSPRGAGWNETVVIRITAAG